MHHFLEEMGQGVQHIASRVDNLTKFIASVNKKRKITGHGFTFLRIPPSYYGRLTVDTLAKAGTPKGAGIEVWLGPALCTRARSDTHTHTHAQFQRTHEARAHTCTHTHTHAHTCNLPIQRCLEFNSAQAHHHAPSPPPQVPVSADLATAVLANLERAGVVDDQGIVKFGTTREDIAAAAADKLEGPYVSMLHRSCFCPFCSTLFFCLPCSLLSCVFYSLFSWSVSQSVDLMREWSALHKPYLQIV